MKKMSRGTSQEQIELYGLPRKKIGDYIWEGYPWDYTVTRTKSEGNGTWSFKANGLD
jgi:hypothetical protein